MDAGTKLLRIVDSARGDDLERATRSFAHLSDGELDERQHGASGMTRREILDDYRADRREWEAARLLAVKAAFDDPNGDPNALRDAMDAEDNQGVDRSTVRAATEEVSGTSEAFMPERVGFVGHEQQADIIASPAERRDEYERDSRPQPPI